MVHLRAVRLVVVDHDHHRQAEPHDGLELGGAHERAAVAQRGDRQPVGPGERGADRGGQPQADRLERLREAEPALVGHDEEHAPGSP